MSTKQYTTEDVISILDFSKDKNVKSKDALLQWEIDKCNRIDEKDEHGLSVVGIFEHPIKNKSGKEIGKIIVFNYTGVGGGWHNDIYQMVDEKYFSNEPCFAFKAGDNESFYYRLFLTGDIFEDENLKEWEQPNKKSKLFKVFKHKLPKSEFIIAYDMSENRDGAVMLSQLERSNEYCFYYDDGYSRYFIKNIHNLNFKPSKPIIEKRIKNRIKQIK